ncbi:MAG: Crp/Fnr family transcriptional regulator [Zetaproteobacteria bacterium CG_4_9_14_3_um_filter_49_83]|nr:MAG: Crp/Fnr family transcriptional regulator [Zetaproteobacteria bacterium CG1_02_49_23]PIQ34239.1 MAG: Crp/Fnr family transcriptional regulator [Zetaproteobacteria bacterium CG17_big_fil_post_rev_8_21_14_2_50_50_13]PIV29538.1 MAG: Crp/Fnr family transcriptional regulator [Zetaproteobacteria bacterium CG02_land_8_20_14_3_00_50_9]PIY57158.1 MAG: Crp/Fnr family transcriptional regulator [Zetaproteobacteria bacterium CG_4_10_14_0_8_um_filter_49_80]PJA33969.1 MAG: Crp/Fnr family transcriptional
MHTQSSPLNNQLLAALPANDYERLLPNLKCIEMPLGKVLYEPGEALHYACFPTDCIVSLMYIMENGYPTEIVATGNEGIVGLALFMGGDTMPNRAVVQSAGHGYCLSTAMLKKELNLNGPLLHLFLRYTQALITLTSQTAACNRHHSLDQRLCRWLLHYIDRLSGNSLVMTQELIASMLGVRREGVTVAARYLQEAGLIEYQRGHITVLNRPGLEKRVCECYQVVKQEFDRLLPSPH